MNINYLFPQKFTRRKKESKEGRKIIFLKIDLVSMQYINVCKLGVQMGKTLKTIKLDHNNNNNNNKFYSFLVETCSKSNS